MRSISSIERMNRNYQLPPEWRTFKPEPEESECFKCSFRGKVDRTSCPRCGKRLYTESNIRMRGVGLILIGFFLALGMTALGIGLFVILGTVRDQDSIRRINDSVPFLIGIYVLFGTIIAYGANAVLAGIWQMATGRRNKLLSWLMGAILTLIIIAGIIATRLPEMSF